MRVAIPICGALLPLIAFTAASQQTQAPAADTGAVFKSETNLVLVDTIVTDKKGNYIRDLKQNDFKVYEDGKEQEVKSFSFQADPASPWNHQKHYMVLFFDNSTMDFGAQSYARKAAASFIDSNAGPNRYIAIINYGGSISVSQNFTDDVDRLKKVVSGIKFSSVDPNDASMPSLTGAVGGFASRDLILALRTTAKNLSGVDGRKILVLLTAGFPVTPELMDELSATIAACNKANVAIYPVDVRGLVTPMGRLLNGQELLLASADRTLAASFAALAAPLAFQRGGLGGGGGSVGGGTVGGGSRGGTVGGGGRAGGGTGGSGTGGRGGTGGTSGGRGASTGTYNSANNPSNLNPQNLIPKFPPSATTNQELMYELASGTGGFVIANTNDLLGGMEKIGKEQNEFYLLGYTPAESKEGSCHSLKVKVDRSGTEARFRTGYCNVKAVDYLSGKPEEKDLEARANSASAGNVQAALQAPFFYDAPNVARVNVAMDIPGSAISFQKEKGKFRSDLNVLGLAVKPDGTVAAKFSDTMHFDQDNKKDVEAFAEKPLHYDNQFDIAPGQYTLKVVFTAGGKEYGKLETPLNIDAYDGKQFVLGGIALSKDAHPLAQDTTRGAELVEDKVPLVTGNIQVTPSGSDHFRKTDPAVIFTQIYAPSLKDEKPPGIGLQLKVLNAKTGELKQDTGFINMATHVKAGDPVIPVGLRLLVSDYGPGQYRAELKAMDTAGHVTGTRSINFSVE
jgi:VWFA-related protein